MVQVIRENRPKSTAERFGNAFSGAAHSLSKDIPEHTMRQRKDEQQRRAIQELMGEDLSNLPEDLQKLYYENFINQQSSNKKFSHEKELQSSKFGHEKDLALLENEEKIKRLIGQENEKNSELQRKTDEKLVPLRSGLQTLQRMRQLGSRGNLGRGSAISGLFGGETAKDRSEYTQLGKSLISLASNIPIRNQKEFETLAHDLYDASLPDKAREGILDAMERIISQSMQQYTGTENETIPRRQSQPLKERPPLSSFHR